MGTIKQTLTMQSVINKNCVLFNQKFFSTISYSRGKMVEKGT